MTIATINNVTYDASTGVLIVNGENFTTTVGASNDVDVSKLVFLNFGGAFYALTSDNVELINTNSFAVILNQSDQDGVASLITGDGSDYFLKANEGFITNQPLIEDFSSTITVSNYTPPVVDPSFAAASYDATSGVLVINGSGFVITDTVDASKFTFTGEGGSQYTLTDTSDVNPTNEGIISITLSETDKNALINNGIINNNGFTADDTNSYQISALEGWMSSASTPHATDFSTIQVINYNDQTPTASITSATYNAGLGMLVVSGSGFTATTGASNDVDVTKLTFENLVGQSHTLTSDNVEISGNNDQFTIILNQTDKSALDSIITGTGTDYLISAAPGFIVDQPTIGDTLDNVVNVTNYTSTLAQITSATYDYNTGALTLTGENFTSETGASNDIDTSRLNFDGYFLTSNDVEITNSTTATIVLNETDKTALATYGFVTGNGPSNEELLANAGWMVNQPDVSDTSGNVVTVTGYPTPDPSFTASYGVDQGNDGDVVSAGDGVTVTGTNLVPGVDYQFRVMFTYDGLPGYIPAYVDTDTGKASTFTLTSENPTFSEGEYTFDELPNDIQSRNFSFYVQRVEEFDNGIPEITEYQPTQDQPTDAGFDENTAISFTVINDEYVAPAPPSSGGGGGGGSSTPVVTTITTPGNDELVFDDGDNEINGLEGDDRLTGLGGNDNLHGGLGNDIINGNTGNDYVQGNQGDDIVRGGMGDDEVRGGQGNDQVFGGFGVDYLYGGNGNDAVQGNADNDYVQGMKGNDEVRGGKGDDVVRGGQGDDSVYGGMGNDNLYGGLGNDTLTGGSDSDVFYLSGGNDTINDFQMGVDFIRIDETFSPIDIDSILITQTEIGSVIEFDLLRDNKRSSSSISVLDTFDLDRSMITL